MKKIILCLLLMINIVAFSDPKIFDSILVEKGSFLMGSSNNDTEAFNDEKPVHQVTFLYDFYIGKYEVTFDEYDSFCNALNKNKPSDEGWGREKMPVINISWFDAITYCNWLSEKEGFAKAYDEKGNLIDANGNRTTDITKVIGYRLGTESEWEYAARGGNKSKGYTYSGSGNVDEIAWFYFNSDYKTHVVGTKKPNELGIFDMSGNVWEWCNDLYASYNNYLTNSARVRRGGGWLSSPILVRSANRGRSSPNTLSSFIGFRLFRTK